MADDEIRLTDVLTTASAIASYLGAAEVTTGHLLNATALLLGEIRMEDLGRPVSPLIRRAPPGVGVGATGAAREFARRWLEVLCGDATAVLSTAEVALMREELSSPRDDREPPDYPATSRRTTS